ncbi:MAG: hypothetical protein IJT69_02950, partial [Clostridia bacterium]|nr:hypothetical protein [Clostridia bacterium]
MRGKQEQYRRERPSAPPKKRRSGALVTIAALAIFAFGLLGMIGLFGGVVRDFLQGAFGFMGYPFFALALLATLFKKALRRRLSRRVVIFGVLLLLVFLAWLQVLTSHAEYAAISEPVSFSAYWNVCYDACLGTSGGVVIGWMVFPLLSLMGKYSAIPLAVLFFVLLFFALMPLMRSAEPARKEGEPVASRRSRSRAEKRVASAGEGRLVLFVDKVRPGQRDARKLKFRGIFSKKSPEPQFFDLTDARPLSAPDGMIPKARPERYDLRQPAENKYAEDFYDDYAPVDPIPSREPARAESRRDEIPAVSGDLPPFIRRYREESAEAVDHLSASRTETESDRSVSRDGASSSSTSDRVAPPTFDVLPKTTIRKPKASVSDIISDVSDLERLRASEPKAPARAPFLGELPDPVPPRTAPSPAKPMAEQVAEVRQTTEEPVTVRQEPAPVAPAVEPIRHEPAPARSVTEPPVSTITPREASAIRPVEQPEPAPIPRRTPIAPVSEPSDPETELPIRTRKPRSDIGGTHRSPETVKPVVPAYIPPNRVEQPDIEQVMREAEEAPVRPYSPPPVTLLKELPPIADAENIEEMGDALIAALRSFNIESTIVDHKTGPTFTRFAVTLPDNMSVNKLTPLEKDIKRKLMVDKKDIRIIPSVPNFDAIGIEVPNKKVSPVGLRSIINSPVFEEKNKLMFAIGVDVSGSPVYGDLLGMPHLLVAGSTGSGKSVCLNVLITSIMYHYSPEFVRFIMIDPKKVELSCYSNMPHMLIPSTITEPDKAINALSWLVDEMERRYDLLKNAGVKGIETYNAKMERTGGKKLYYIVFIIDEMADLMYTA